MDFRKVIYKNVGKKNIHFTTKIYTYAGHILKFYFVHILYNLQRAGLSLKNSHYAHIPSYIHKTLPTSGNEKGQ